MTLPIRQAVSPREARAMDTAGLRANFLVEDLFAPGRMSMTYAHYDRTIVGGVVPLAEPVALVASKPVGSPRFMDRREMGVICLQGRGSVTLDGERFELGPRDCLYIPKGIAQVEFASADAADPARFYCVSTPAHAALDPMLITETMANRLDLGSQSDANRRVLRQYIHPDIVQSCQLVMGITTLETGSIWNTMPCHIHDRRSEVYLYFDMAEETRVVHLMGEPDETRHLIVANEQAILSPGWSIHSGAGTGRYAFVWSMGGDNQDFTDMDFIAMNDLR